MATPLQNPVLIHVCTTCRAAGDTADAARPGALLHAALLAAQAEEQETSVRILPVECLSVCKRPCTISFSAPGKWTYVYGDLAPDVSAATILSGAALYAETTDGIVAWRSRPEALKRGVVARIPPLPQVLV